MRSIVFRCILFSLILCFPLSAEVVKLYLRDGSYQLAREYKVEGDRVKFYSTDRDEWEEIPLEMADLKKTESEIKARKAALSEDSKADVEEDKAERAAARQIRLVPPDPGAYLVKGEATVPMKVGEVQVANNKRRSILKVLSPIPMVTGKATLEMNGAHSATIVNGNMPEFYLRLSEEERFGIIKMGEHNGNRVVEKLTIVPVTKEIVEEPTIVPTFHQQAGDMLYKIWPEKALEPGEYAVVEWTEGKVNMQTWDFAVASAK